MLLVDAISQHWQQVFPGKVLVMPYERIVMDLEAAARDMLSHCGLPWDESVLQFHQNQRTVQTASLAQVQHHQCCSSCCCCYHRFAAGDGVAAVTTTAAAVTASAGGSAAAVAAANVAAKVTLLQCLPAVLHHKEARQMLEMYMHMANF